MKRVLANVPAVTGRVFRIGAHPNSRSNDMKTTRRSFLGTAAATSLAAPALPLVPLGAHRISRLIIGGNPMSGFSHVSPALDNEMLDYYNAANTKEVLRRCEAQGVNAWQSRADKHVVRLLREYRNEGGRIQWIAQTASEMADVKRNIREIAAAGAIGAYHHGATTDSLWRGGKAEVVVDRLKTMRDAGLRVGLGSHTPEVIDDAESRGLDIDFYMTCLYNLSRTGEEAARIAGRVVEGEFFHEPDRAAMLERVRKTKRQCLIFKVYGAGRRCRSEADMRAALRQVFDSAKPQDSVVVGMFPKNADQIAQNCRLVMECSAGARTQACPAGLTGAAPGSQI